MTALVHASGWGGNSLLSKGTLMGREAAEAVIKDEGLILRVSFKARGMTAAVSRASLARRFGGSYGGQCGRGPAAYPRPRAPAVIVMPADTPSANVMGMQAFAPRSQAERVDLRLRKYWPSTRTAKAGMTFLPQEPYRIEGKRPWGYELWEPFGGKLPDVILYPTEGGVGLIGNVQSV